MHVIKARNVNDAYVDGLWLLKVENLWESTRNGPVISCKEPVCTVYAKPTERVLFDELRDANPFFHLFECVWMLAGHREVAPLVNYNKRMAEFSDDGVALDGAYGFRWRHHFSLDQLETVISMLQVDKTTRRAVLTMWDPDIDLNSKSKDVPCNTHIYFRVMPVDKLDITVCCRSNDAIWGAYGANAVHFSYLQEFIAGAAGLLVGSMYQISNNFHIYQNLPKYDEIMKMPAIDKDPYNGRVEPYSLGITSTNWRHVLKDYDDIVCGLTPKNYATIHSEVVLKWMFKVWNDRKEGKDITSLIAEARPHLDWHLAAIKWLDRHAK